MIPSNGVVSMYAKIIGDQTLLAIAQGNLLSNLERVVKVRTHTYISFNGQTEHGTSNNSGSKRHYSWEDTIIDCRNAPGLVGGDFIKDWSEALRENKRFNKLKDNLEVRMGGHISVEPFYSVLLGDDNMRYNIKRSSKIDDFDIIRVGMRLTAKDDDTFKEGLITLKEESNLFKIKSKSFIENTALQMA